jgi:ribosome-associated protein
LKQALLLTQAAVDKKAVFPVLLEVTDLVSYADYLLIVTATSKPHIEAIISSCSAAAKANEFTCCGQEGLEKGKWVLVDYGDVILHAFMENERGYYDLEGLWRDAPRVDIPGVETVQYPMDYHAS